MRFIPALIALLGLAACANIDKEYLRTGVRTEQLAEIRVALQKITKSPLVQWEHGYDDASNVVRVYTADLKSYRAIKVGGRWHFEEFVTLAHLPNQSNQAMQRTAGRAALQLSMTSTFNPQPRSPSPAVADLVSR